jgi:hypothetical protein
VAKGDSAGFGHAYIRKHRTEMLGANQAQCIFNRRGDLRIEADFAQQLEHVLPIRDIVVDHQQASVFADEAYHPLLRRGRGRYFELAGRKFKPESAPPAFRAGHMQVATE